MRIERDILGERELPEDAYYGIHTLRSCENFPFSGQTWPAGFIRAFAVVKRACASANAELGFLSKERFKAVASACEELEAGKLHEWIVTDPFQGGAGTSTNMNFNEVIASRASELLGGARGSGIPVHPFDHVNMHQSTNDVFPTALKIAVFEGLKTLEGCTARLQETLQDRETEFRDVVTVGRTELMDGVPVTMGMVFGAMSEAVSRDRWRIFKCRERIKRVNLGGTAVGTGLGAPRDYVLRVAEHLKRLSVLPFSRAENVMDATRNMDCFVEVSGMLKTQASNLIRLCSDLRLLASGPASGFGEITLPPLQAGSSIMAGKINPVMPEGVTQIALRILGNDQVVTSAASMGQLELNHLLPLIAHSMLESLGIAAAGVHGLAERCVSGVTADRERCALHVRESSALAAVLVPVLGYGRVEEILAGARTSGRSVVDELAASGIASQEEAAELLSPKRLCRPGFTDEDFKGLELK